MKLHMWLGYTAVFLVLVSLPLMCSPRLYGLGMTLFALALVLAPVAVVLAH